MTSVVGCGSGLSHRAATKTPDVFSTMDAELRNAIGTTSVTSESMPLPGSRLSIAQWEEEQAPAPALQTWGASPDDALPSELAASPYVPTAKADPASYP